MKFDNFRKLQVKFLALFYYFDVSATDISDIERLI